MLFFLTCILETCIFGGFKDTAELKGGSSVAVSRIDRWASGLVWCSGINILLKSASMLPIAWTVDSDIRSVYPFVLFSRSALW